jgi:hypothetical protein
MAFILGALLYGGAAIFAALAGWYLAEGDQPGAIKAVFITVMLAGVGKGLRWLMGVTPPPGLATRAGWGSRALGAAMAGLMAPVCVLLAWQQWLWGSYWQVLILLGLAAIGVLKGVRLWRRGFTADDFG